ncbi:hypothetical protein RHOSPDRAFT_31852 [Rhodotorula sp. JG-1b]|nr:hypothetical protein RHOSPDRAFT_31852 [Rhodotorula sp. JG-1b]
MSWLWSWWTPPVVPPEPTPAQLTDQRLNALHSEWMRVQERNRADCDAVLAKLVDENDSLRHKLETTERELKDVKAGRKEEETELRVIRAELQSLTADKSGTPHLRVAVLDLEEDFFSPRILYPTNPARALFEALRRLSDEILETYESPTQAIKRALPSTIFDGSVDLVRQRQSAYAIAFARAVSCKRLLLGRWALDLRFLESICPPPGQTERPVGDKILLIEPVAGQYVPPQIRRCGLRFIRMSGVIRSHPVQAGDSVSATPQLNFRKPLWQQNPPLCLDFYLDGKRCFDEACCFSHAYRLHPDVTESLRYESRCRFPTWMHAQLTQTVPLGTRPARPSAAGDARVAPPPSPPKRAFSPARHSIQPSSPFGHPLSTAPRSPHGTAANVNIGHLSDAELAKKLAKARQEELEYERGLAEDPFVAG